MRVTQGMMYNSYINDMSSRQDSMYTLNNEVATGLKLNAPSDDPLGTSQLLSSKSALSGLDQTGRNVDSAVSYLNTAEGSLNSAKDLLTSIHEIAIQGASDTENASSRSNLASVVKSLYDQLISVANTQVGGRYIFSGFKTDTAAFDSSGNFQGDANSYQVNTGSSNMTVGVNGGEVFKGTGLVGGVDVLQSVSNLVTALNNNDTAGIQSAISSVDASSSQVINAVSDIGARSSRLSSIQNDLSNSKLEVQKTISNLQDADLTKVVSQLQLGQIALQASMASAGKIFSLNIFNYL